MSKLQGQGEVVPRMVFVLGFCPRVHALAPYPSRGHQTDYYHPPREPDTVHRHRSFAKNGSRQGYIEREPGPREPVTSNEDFVLRYTSQANVLSLGLVFLGILAVLEGKDIVKVCQKLSGEESEYGRDYQVLG